MQHIKQEKKELSDQEFIELLERAVDNLSWCLQESGRRKMKVFIKYREHQYDFDEYFSENRELRLMYVRKEFFEILYKGIEKEAKNIKED